MERLVALVVYPGIQSLDVTGPVEVLSAASDAAMTAGARSRPYRIAIAAAGGPGPVATSSGLALVAERGLDPVRGRLDTLLVAGGTGAFAAAEDEALRRGVRRLARRARRVASVCTGAFVLAAAGLLDGRRATTHWAAAGELARRFPRVAVDPDPIFVRDGSVWTSAGVTAGMDLALALVEEDLGAEVALAVARRLVLYVRRPGGQAQWSVQLAAQAPTRRPLRDLLAWVAEHPEADLSVARLAARAAMSPRHFARAFRSEVGTTPAVHVERVRVEAAQRLLATTDLAVEAVAAACGFGAPETLRRAFARRTGVSPRDYRRRFRPALAPLAPEENDHGRGHPAVRPAHRPRRRRPLRGAEPAARRPRALRGRATR